MQIFSIVIALISFFMIIDHSVADTVILKSGRTVAAAQCWEDGDVIKSKLYGQVEWDIIKMTLLK